MGCAKNRGPLPRVIGSWSLQFRPYHSPYSRKTHWEGAEDEDSSAHVSSNPYSPRSWIVPWGLPSIEHEPSVRHKLLGGRFHLKKWVISPTQDLTLGNIDPDWRSHSYQLNSGAHWHRIFAHHGAPTQRRV